MSVQGLSSESLINRPDFYFNPPALGEPDPSAYYDGITPRARVEQSAKSGMECWYTVMSWLRPSIGNNFAPQFEIDYNTEQLIAHRRTMLNLAKNYMDKTLFLDTQLKEEYQVEIVTKKVTARFQLDSSMDDFSQETLKKFHEQTLTDNLSEFALHDFYRKCNESDEYFLYGTLNEKPEKDFCIENLREFITNLHENTSKLHLQKPWDALSLLEKRWALGTMANMACARLFGLEQAGWNFHKNVTNLIQEMQEHGPLMVQGYFGQPYYKDKPFQLADKVGQRTIWGWKPDAVRQENDKHHIHPILVVGGRSDTKTGHVYFIDALDKSDPCDSDSARVYIMSYPKFTEQIATLEGLKTKQDEIMPEANNFAWYSPLKI
ncbi:MAG: hypothetical protein S4CHLAM123_12060 [Chlamydiales bacterium]|nr:hypothetical protein [Chlamydiales bacterium]